MAKRNRERSDEKRTPNAPENEEKTVEKAAKKPPKTPENMEKTSENDPKTPKKRGVEDLYPTKILPY